MLTLHRRLLALRRGDPALTVGGYRTVSADDAVLVYGRHHEGRRLVVALNLTSVDQPRQLAGETLLSTYLDQPPPGTLRADEGRILAVR